MRIFTLIIIVVFGILTILVEFRTTKQTTIFLDIFEYIPIAALCFFTGIFLLINIFQRTRSKKIFSLVPCLSGLFFLFIYFNHQRQRKVLDESDTLFKADTYIIGSDGGFRFDFKKNKHLKAEKLDHWALTEYWGNYEAKHDTIILHIDLNFSLPRQAIRTDSTLIFSTDTVFRIIKMY